MSEEKKLQLHNYQLKMIDFCKQNKNCVLAVGMGLGKTAAVLHFINNLNPKNCLIVAPKRVTENVWLQEANKWHLSNVYQKMIIVSGTKEKRSQALTNEAKPYKIIGRDNLKDLIKVNLTEFDLIVLDELTSFKNHNSNRSKIINYLKSNRYIGLTGTFLANGAIDVYGQLVAVGIYNNSDVKLINKNFYRWRSTYFYDALAGSGLQWHKWVLNTSLDNLLKPVKNRIFTLDSEDWLEVPPVSFEMHKIVLTNDEMLNYIRLNATLSVNLSDEILTVSEAAKFIKLQTLCNGFIYDADGKPVRGNYSTKLQEVADFVEDCVNESEQVLLFYAFIEEAIWLSEMLKERNIKFCSPNDKNFLKKWNEGEIDVLIAHPASAGHGLNLQEGGRIIVWSSITYNFEYWKQANARLIRQGQMQNVQIHVFSAKNTIEDAQYNAIMKKQKEYEEFINLTKINNFK